MSRLENFYVFLIKTQDEFMNKLPDDLQDEIIPDFLLAFNYQE